MEYFWIGILIFLMLAALVSSDEVVLVNKPGCSLCGWNWVGFKLQEKEITGWGLQQSPSRYVSCDVNLKPSVPRPNSWLRSDRIKVDEAKRIDITVEFLFRSCSNINQNGGRYCVNSFDLYVNQSDRHIVNVADYPDPLHNIAAYEKVAEIQQPTDTRGSKTISVLVKGKYILLSFHNYGACCVLYSVKVSYNICPGGSLTSSLVRLPRTVAPASDSELNRIQGSCEKDAVHIPGSLFVYCQSDGEWNTDGLQGRCVCREDMQNVKGECQGCPDGLYNDQSGLNCTVLPSAPKDANVSFVNQSVVELRWRPPAVTGDKTRVFYEVNCRKSCDIGDANHRAEKSCGSNVRYIPYKDGLNATQVVVTNLLPYMNYTFQVHAINRVSEMAKRKYGMEGNFTTVTLRTSGSIPGKPEVSVEQTKSAVVVSWELKQKNGVIKNYHVTYIRKDDSSDSKSLTTKKTEKQFTGLKAGKTYKFQVSAENNFGKGPSGVKTFTLKDDGSAGAMVIVYSAGGGGLLLILFITVIAIVFVKRKRHRSIEKDYLRTIEQGSDLQSMDQRRYIDPGNYLDLLELLSTFTSELERSKIKLDGLIGQGEFADVYKGTLKTREGRDVVAVKVLRPGSNEKNQKDFLSEASIMGQFNHRNVIGLVGVVTQGWPMMILTEFLESGSLDHFLKARDGQLTNLQLLGMARGVACGMVYLAGMNFIHRDLAARNVLVGENMSCKVSDFGLSRELADDHPDSEYQTQGGKIPVRWTAPEALQHRKFSSASDMWSFGILLWEIMSFSDRPYWDWNNYDVISRVETGYRLPPPKGCPKLIHNIMLDCWDKDKNKRPKFCEIVSRLEELIRTPERLINDSVLCLQSKFLEGDIPEFSSVEEWLKYLNMEAYSETFKAANLKSLMQVTKMEEKDLKEIGIKLIGHRNKMNKSIKAMKS